MFIFNWISVTQIMGKIKKNLSYSSIQAFGLCASSYVQTSFLEMNIA